MTLAIDPGPTESAYVWLHETPMQHPVEIMDFGKKPNAEVLNMVSFSSFRTPLVIEQVACYGMPVGEEVFETVYWTGRFAQAWSGPVHRIKRTEVKMHLCHQTKGVNDSVIRQRLIDLFGGKDKAIGRKGQKGPLHGISKDVWQALALGITFEQTRQLAAK